MTASKPLIDVIVSVYRVEEYLPKCVQSLLSQDFERFIVTLVDDGSPDGCPALCDAYAAENPGRVRVIHQENTGQAAARNRAVARSEADFIAFVDADDWLSPGYLSALYGAAERTGAGIAAARICTETLRPDGTAVQRLYPEPENGLMDRDQALAALCMEGVSGISGLLCGKLTRREIMLANPFPAGRIFEDSFVLWRQVMASGKLVCVPEAVYHYLQRPGSTQHMRFTPRHMDLLDAVEEMMDAFRAAELPPAVLAAGACKVCRSCYVTAFHAADLPFDGYREACRRIIPLLRRYYPPDGIYAGLRLRCRLLLTSRTLFYLAVRLAKGPASRDRRTNAH